MRREPCCDGFECDEGGEGGGEGEDSGGDARERDGGDGSDLKEEVRGRESVLVERRGCS